ncbi:MAG: iron-containing alcohol dehydrogenase [Deltaproteobacteria bacterium]|nr:iron-containing alcohol dehydrogenase [Deltaproteobacteria bacterium]
MTKDFNFILPTRIIFGFNMAEKVGEIVLEMGLTNILVVTDRSFSRLPVFHKLIGRISDAGISHRIFDKLEGEPDTEIAEEGAEFLREAQTNGILGVGGGSSMDLAKALSVLATNKGTVNEYMGVNLVRIPPLPLIVVPTTAGSGSEVTHVAVLTDIKKKLKGAIVSNLIPPQAAIMDPSLLATLPSRVIAETGIDALSHAIEAFYSLGSNPISDILAKDAIRRITSNLRALVVNSQNVSAAGNMMLGSMLAGAAFLNTGVGNVHALAHSLGAYYHISHALSVAVLLPYVMEHNLKACMERFAEMTAAMGTNIEGMSLRESARKAVDEVRSLLTDIGIPGRLSELQVTDTYFRDMAQDAAKSPPSLSNPRRCTVDELMELYRKAI